MQIRKLCWLCGTATIIVVVIVTALAIVVKHEPSFYRQAPEAGAKGHEEMKAALLVGPFQMYKDIKEKRESWWCHLTEAHINCFLEKELHGLPQAANLRSLGISSPRVSLDNDEIRLAFRYGEGWFSTVITYHLKVWLVPKEENLIAVQVLSARAGGLPISSQTVFQHLTDFAIKQDCKVTLYRHEGTPVATINTPPIRENSYYYLTEFKFRTNALSIQGKTSEEINPGSLPGQPAVIEPAQ